MASGASNVDTAKAVGVSEQTLRKWMKYVPGFAKSVELGRANLPTITHDSLLREVPAMERRAVEVLKELMEQNDNLKVKLEAARMVFSLPSMMTDGGAAVTVNFPSMPEPGIPSGVTHRAD